MTHERLRPIVDPCDPFVSFPWVAWVERSLHGFQVHGSHESSPPIFSRPMLFALACPVFKITNLQSEMQSEMEVVGVSTGDDVKSYTNKDITLDGHRMVYKTKYSTTKKVQ